MNLRILGYSGGYPGAGVPTSGYLLTIGRKNILIDCGSGVLAELQKFLSVECLDMIILTHLHHDHISDLSVLRYALEMKSKHGQQILPIPVYAPNTPEDTFERMSDDPFLPVSVIDPSVIIRIADAVISFHPTSHSVECYGLRVEYNNTVYSYSSDSAYDPMLFEYLSESDLSILDCGGLEGDGEGRCDQRPDEEDDCGCKEGIRAEEGHHLFTAHCADHFGIHCADLAHLLPEEPHPDKCKAKEEGSEDDNIHYDEEEDLPGVVEDDRDTGADRVKDLLIRKNRETVIKVRKEHEWDDDTHCDEEDHIRSRAPSHECHRYDEQKDRHKCSKDNDDQRQQDPEIVPGCIPEERGEVSFLLPYDAVTPGDDEGEEQE